MKRGSRPEAGRISSMGPDRAREELDETLAELIAESRSGNWTGIKNAVVQVEVPELRFVHQTALGEADPLTGEPMTPEHQFHLASVTKTMTATAILQMWEEGRLGAGGLDATLADL